MDSFKDVLEAAQAYCKTQMAEPTYNLYIDGLEPISFEDSSHITLSVRNDFICKIVTDRCRVRIGAVHSDGADCADLGLCALSPGASGACACAECAASSAG